jgi:hypothetical protein
MMRVNSVETRTTSTAFSSSLHHDGGGKAIFCSLFPFKKIVWRTLSEEIGEASHYCSIPGVGGDWRRRLLAA